MNNINELITPDVIKFAKIYSAIEHCCKLFVNDEYDTDYDYLSIDNYELNYALDDIKANDFIFYCRFMDELDNDRCIQFLIDTSVFLTDENPDLIYNKLDFNRCNNDVYRVLIKQESNVYFENC